MATPASWEGTRQQGQDRGPVQSPPGKEVAWDEPRTLGTGAKAGSSPAFSNELSQERRTSGHGDAPWLGAVIPL